MKNFRHSSKKGAGNRRNNNSNRKKTVDLLIKLIHRHLMSPQGGGHATFSHVNLEGTNVGSTMVLRRSRDSEGSSDLCSINVYINNNVQGVNNSILVGSKVIMGDPGVELSIADSSDSLRRKKQDVEVKEDSVWGGWRCFWFLFFIAISVLIFCCKLRGLN